MEEDTCKLELRSKTDEGETTGNEKTKRIIDLKGRNLFNYFVIMVTGWFIRFFFFWGGGGRILFSAMGDKKCIIIDVVFTFS